MANLYVVVHNEREQLIEWALRHNDAVIQPRSGFEHASVTMLRGWEAYANAHRERFKSPISEDYVLGPQWEQIGQSLLGLLNGELGRLDGGTLDRFIRETLTKHGFDPNK